MGVNLGSEAFNEQGSIVASRVYEIQVAGRLPDEVVAEMRAEFGDAFVTAEPARTRITGRLPDQAALIGMLEQLHAWGMKVCEVRGLGDLDGADQDRPVTQESDAASYG